MNQFLSLSPRLPRRDTLWTPRPWLVSLLSLSEYWGQIRITTGIISELPTDDRPVHPNLKVIPDFELFHLKPLLIAPLIQGRRSHSRAPLVLCPLWDLPDWNVAEFHLAQFFYRSTFILSWSWSRLQPLHLEALMVGSFTSVKVPINQMKDPYSTHLISLFFPLGPTQLLPIKLNISRSFIP